MTVYKITDMPKGPLKDAGGWIWSYDEENDWWLCKNRLIKYAQWTYLLVDRGPLIDYVPLYTIEIDGNKSLGNAWDQKCSLEEAIKKLEIIAAEQHISKIKAYERGVKLITDHAEYIIKEA